MENTLVKYDYDSLPESWKENNINNYKGVVFLCLGEIKNQPDHVSCIEIKTGKIFIFDIDTIVALTEDEL